MKKNTILLVEDNEHIMNANAVALSRDGYTVLKAATLADAYREMARDIDLIVLDIMMPDGSGLTFCEAVKRKHRDIMILFLTARTGADNTVEGFYAGGDDYMSKPYDLRELRARVGALLKRRALNRQDWDSIRLDLVTQRAMVHGKDAMLKPKEFITLSLLLGAEGECISPQELYEKGWGCSDNNDVRTIRVHIFHIRQKLEACGATDVKIEHIRGEGYRLIFV